MSDVAIQVENLSKRYRIGTKEVQHDTLMSAAMSWMRSPLNNFRRLRRLSAFQNGDEADVLWALRDVSFTVKHGEVIGIIGRNGAGKSTLLKILSRITPPTGGKITLNGRVASLLEVGTGFHPELTGRENVYLNGTVLGMTKIEVDRKFNEIVDFSGVEKFIDTPVKRYSSGMKVRLAFAVAAHLEPEILLVDEVLAVGDAEFQKKCLNKMHTVSTEGRTVLFVSHDMDALLNLCPTSLVLNLGEIIFRGHSEEAVKGYLSSFAPSGEATAQRHVLYQADKPNNDESTYLNCVEMLDEFDQAKPMAYTWDAVKLRLHYIATEPVPHGSFVVDIRDYKQQRLVVLDSGLRIPIQQGQHYVDCYIPRLDLAAGEYYLGVGLAISNNAWLWRSTNLAPFRVHGRDVFSIGRPPVTSRMLFAVEHEWAAPTGKR